MTRQEAIEILKQRKDFAREKYPELNDYADALDVGIRSMELWDGFIERLAAKCNESSSAAEWNIHRKAIELIKKEFDEKIG